MRLTTIFNCSNNTLKKSAHAKMVLCTLGAELSCLSLHDLSSFSQKSAPLNQGQCRNVKSKLLIDGLSAPHSEESF